MTKLALRIKAGGNCVLIVRRDGGEEAVPVTAGEVRRFCWAALNDLDPEEAAARAPPAKRPGRKGDPSQRDAVLAALRKCDATAVAISETVGMTSGQVSARLQELIHRGYAANLTPGAWRSRYRITDEGRAYLAAVRP